MPNVKLFVDPRTPNAAALPERLTALRDMIIAHLDVPVSASQIAIVEAVGVLDQPAINVELRILPGPARTRAALTELAEAFRSQVQQVCDVAVAVRIDQLDPETYVALK